MEVVADRFELLEVAGRGGFGEVWRASDRETGRTVAFKRPTVPGGPRLRQRFDAEIAILAHAAHPALVGYVAHGEDRERRPWLAMEWIEGLSLASRLAERSLTPEEARALGQRVAEGLAQLHAIGIVHRDVKPENVLLEAGDARRPKLIDFGIAQAGGPRVTRPGGVMGTPGYLAPEQASGGEADARSDVFSLGVVLYECLTGVAPFDAEHPVASLTKTLLEEPPPISEVVEGHVPPALEALVAAMMSKDADGRPPDGDAAARMLASVAQGTEAVRRGAPRVGAGERQLLSLLVGEHGRDHDGDTLDQGAVDALRATIAEVAERFGASLVMASGASFAVTVPRGRVGTDGPRRAVRCALALAVALPEHRLAVATARAGAEGAVGETIERAAALVPRGAVDARVAVDPVTASLLDGRFVIAAEGDSAFVVRELAGPPRPRARAPLVGRDRELAALRRRYERVVRDASPAVAVVTAEAGLGKSRLAAELLPTLVPAPRVAWAAGDPTRGAPFALAAHLVAQVLEVPPSASRETLEERLGVLEGALDYLPELFAGATQPVDPALHAARLRASASAAVDVVAEGGPILIVLDDAQHADTPTLDWLDALSRPREGARVMVLALATPDLADAHPLLFARREPTTLALGPLSMPAAHALAAHLLPDADEPTTSTIVARSDGHPFHLEELCRAHARGAPAESLLSLVEARIARLGPDARRALRAASLLGDRFDVDALDHLLGHPDGATLAAALREAVDAQLLVPLEASGAHRFRQRLVRDAAMAMLPEEDRRVGHRLAAEHLAAHGGETAAVAHHWGEAGRPAQAAAWLTRAADEALSSHDLRGALDLAARAEAHAPPSPTGLRVVAEAKVWSGRAEEALEAAGRAMEHASHASVDWLRAASVATAAAGSAGKPERIAPLAESLRAIEPTDETRAALVLALTRTSGQLYFTGSPVLGRALLDRAGALLNRHRDRLAEARLAQVRSIAASFEGDPKEALAATREAIQGYRAMRDDRSAAICLSNLGSILSNVGRYAEARRELDAAIALAEVLELEPILVAARITRSGALLGEGHPHPAVREADLALARVIGSGHVRFHGGAAIAMARARLALGDLDGAASALADVVPALSGVPSLRAQALAVRAQIAISRGDTGPALTDATDAMRLFERAGADEGEALVRRAHVAALRAANRIEDAERAVTEARAWLIAKLDALPPELAAPMRAMPDHAFLLR